ncbi:MAG: hypothetical protein RL414_634, partial [Actinomycetota bacterium]
GFIAAILSPIFPFLSFLIVAAVLPFARWIAFVAHFASQFPVIALPGSFAGAAISLIALYALYRQWWKLVICVAMVLAFFFTYQYFAWPGKNWVVANCDVGQGDAAVINLGNHQGLVIDTGPDPVVMDRCLKELHITAIPLLVISHSHADHAGGVEGAKRHRTVGSIWYSAKIGAVTDFEAPVGHVRITTLWPGESSTTFDAMPGDGSAVNNQSIAMIVEVSGIRYFSAGDIEPPAQEAIVHTGLLQDVDLIKVSHHGSAYQYIPLLDALHPEVAFISVGKGNTYGHPAPTTLAELEKRHIRTVRTDMDGVLVYYKDGRVKTKKKALISLN